MVLIEGLPFTVFSGNPLYASNDFDCLIIIKNI